MSAEIAIQSIAPTRGDPMKKIPASVDPSRRPACTIAFFNPPGKKVDEP
jgi:hypothetical protein